MSRIPVSKKDRVRSEAKKRRVADYNLSTGIDAEAIAVESRLTTVIPQTAGGTLTALRENELRDGSTYTLPLASSTLINQTIIISLTDEYKTFTPLVNAGGGDTITYSGIADTSILFNTGSSISITLTSDGVSNWGL